MRMRMKSEMYLIVCEDSAKEDNDLYLLGVMSVE
jgi:hypothetical protein